MQNREACLAALLVTGLLLRSDSPRGADDATTVMNGLEGTWRLVASRDGVVTSFPPLVIFSRCFSGRMMPPLGNNVYAVAISYGVASNTPSVIDGYGLGAAPTPSFFQKAEM